jgi:signal transduction histidine kinase
MCVNHSPSNATVNRKMVFSGNQQERDLRLRFMSIDPEVSRALAEFWPLIEPELSDIVDGFCRHVTSAPPPNSLSGADMTGLKSALALHWESLFSGDFGDAYFDSVRSIGHIRRTIGLEPGLYLGGCNLVHGRLVAIVLRQSDWSRAQIQSAIVAVGSAIALDTDLAVSAFVASAADIARQRVSKLLSGLPAAIYTGIVEPGGRLIRFEFKGNAERVSGWHASEFESWEAWIRKAEAIDSFVWRAHFEKVTSEGSAAIEYDFLHKAGSLLRLRDQVRVIERLEGGRVEVAGYISDITRDHTTRARAVTSAKLATLGEMASGLAHEINQPFTIMSLAAENSAKMLQERGPEGIGYTIDRLHRIRDQAARARTIIDHLRLFGGQGSDTKAPVRLIDAVEGAFSLVDGAIRAAGVVVTNELDNSLPPVFGGLGLVEQVLVNLMLNALDAMEKNPEGAARHLMLRSSADTTAKTVSLSISDTGPGIPNSILERLFDPFFTTKEVGKGIGLGLSICHGIMTSFGGSITADNVPEGGAVFIVTFQKAHAVRS